MVKRGSWGFVLLEQTSFLIQASLTALNVVCGKHFLYKCVYVSWSHFVFLNLVSSNQAGILVLTVKKENKQIKAGSLVPNFQFLTSNGYEKFVTHTIAWENSRPSCRQLGQEGRRTAVLAGYSHQCH